MFAKHLGNDCSSTQNSDLVISSLKAIGNIGYFKKLSVLENCALRKENSLEVRVNAIQSLRNFDCATLESSQSNYKLLKDNQEDSEVRISAFDSLVRCSDSSEQFKKFSSNDLPSFLLSETDIQVDLALFLIHLFFKK